MLLRGGPEATSAGRTTLRPEQESFRIIAAARLRPPLLPDFPPAICWQIANTGSRSAGSSPSARRFPQLCTLRRPSVPPRFSTGSRYCRVRPGSLPRRPTDHWGSAERRLHRERSAVRGESRREPVGWLRKNQTVIGIIGKTHSVKIAASPRLKAMSRNCGRSIL
jgi:hypothetical protein